MGIAAGAWPLAVGGAEPEGNLYTPVESAVTIPDSITPANLDLYGDWVVYQPSDFGGGKGYNATNLDNGAVFSVAEPRSNSERTLAIWGDTVAWVIGYGPCQIVLHDLVSGEDAVVIETKNYVGALDLWENVIAWQEYDSDTKDSILKARDLDNDQEYEVATGPEYRPRLRLWDDVVVWEEAAVAGQQRDVLGYRLSTGKVINIAANPWDEFSPALSDNVVVWVDSRTSLESGNDIYSKNLTTGVEKPICTAPGNQDLPAIWGDLIVWADARNLETVSGLDIYGYDLDQKQEFAVTRHIGTQTAPAIYDHTVAWQDWRSAPQVKYSTGTMYVATLETEPTADPLPVAGAPAAFDGLIEVVWPHSGQPGTATDMVNIGAYLFSPAGSLREVPCSFDPPLELWVAENNRPAELVEVVTHRSWNWSPSVWHFNDVDVSLARNPDYRLLFFLKAQGDYQFRTNVWAHAADARTFFPQQMAVRSAQAEPPTAVDAVIQIVWPHDNLPVDQADQVNISANLFAHNSDSSVPGTWDPEVILYRSLNNGIGEPVAIGVKRLIKEGSLAYPVWDFNDIDVEEARDPQNKYYFRIEVEGVETHSTVWAHGADARTYFPQPDVPECRCNECAVP